MKKRSTFEVTSNLERFFSILLCRHAGFTLPVSIVQTLFDFVPKCVNAVCLGLHPCWAAWFHVNTQQRYALAGGIDD